MKKSLLILLLFSACQEISSEEKGFDSTYFDAPVAYELRIPGNLQKDSIDLLVLLDGDEYFGIASNTAFLYEFGERMNQNIILSLPSNEMSRWRDYTPTRAEADNDGGQRESYQYSGGFDNFANFLQEELIPSLEEEYELSFRNKSLFGHSMGGLGVLSFLVLRPEIFDNYIAASPSTMYDQHYIFKTIEEKGQLDFDRLFISAAQEDAGGYRENVNWLDEYLQTNKKEGQQVKKVIYTEENHATSGIKSLIDGLAFFYE